MDKHQYSTLMDALKDVPDPRQARGKRYRWVFLLALICGALASGQRTGHAIGHWVHLHGREILELLQPARQRVPSESTLRRALQAVEVQALEERVALFTQGLEAQVAAQVVVTTASGEVLQGQAVDGKEVRGARAHGQPLCLVSLAQHGSGIVLNQMAVGQDTNEITAAPLVLAGCDLRGKVVTMDAILAQRSLAQQIVDQGGHYLMVIKGNQPELHESIALLFHNPPWLRQEREREYRVHQTVSKGHGRLETRILESSPTLGEYLDWPGLGQVLRRQCRRVVLKTGAQSAETTLGITSLPWSEVDVADIETLWRGHWTVENRLHYVRDVTLGEDACQMRAGHAAHALATLRNAILTLLRWKGWDNISDAMRYYGASVRQALELIGAVPT
jgi:predicted transposase YbfD/YdcC